MINKRGLIICFLFLNLFCLLVEFKFQPIRGIARIYITSLKNISNVTVINERKILKHDKWIVVTTINNPTKQLNKLSSENGFKLAAVADLKTNLTWFLKEAVYLDVNTQKNSLSYKSLQTTPFNSYTRKNIGYLYAIQKKIIKAYSFSF